MQAYNWKDVEAQEQGEFERITAGGYVCKIVDVKDVPEKEYLLVTMDVSEGKFANNGVETEKRTGNDWGYLKCYRSYKEAARGFFKAFLVALEKSNSKFNADKFDGNEKKMVGLTVGVLLQEEEYVGQNKQTGANVKKTRLIVYNTVDANVIRSGKFKTPKLKELSDEDKAKLDNYNGGDYTPFSNAPVMGEEELPF